MSARLLRYQVTQSPKSEVRLHVCYGTSGRNSSRVRPPLSEGRLEGPEAADPLPAEGDSLTSNASQTTPIDAASRSRLNRSHSQRRKIRFRPGITERQRRSSLPPSGRPTRTDPLPPQRPNPPPPPLQSNGRTNRPTSNPRIPGHAKNHFSFPERSGKPNGRYEIGSGAPDCAGAPSHTTGRAVFRIRRLRIVRVIRLKSPL